MRRKLAVGNWKMHGLAGDLRELDSLAEAHRHTACDVVVCPPATLIATAAARIEGTPLMVGAQDCHPEDNGAHTGDIAAPMLADAGARHVILGHSERRTDHGEGDGLIAAKMLAANRVGLQAILCVGETEQERDAGQTLDVIARQLSNGLPDDATAANTVIAYEPVWAIGTGRVPDDTQIEEVHGFLRSILQERDTAQGDAIRLLYGGSVKPDNAAAIFAIPDVDGALVGGASLRASDFSAIIAALEAARG